MPRYLYRPCRLVHATICCPFCQRKMPDDDKDVERHLTNCLEAPYEIIGKLDKIKEYMIAPEETVSEYIALQRRLTELKRHFARTNELSLLGGTGPEIRTLILEKVGERVSKADEYVWDIYQYFFEMDDADEEEWSEYLDKFWIAKLEKYLNTII